MTLTKNLSNAIDLATRLHAHQTDKAGDPYIEHPLRVLKTIQEQGYDEWVQMAAVLHDTLEDCEITSKDLFFMGYSFKTIKAVEAMTRWPGQSSKDYYANIKTNVFWRAIKLADIKDNTNPRRMSLLPANVRNRLESKYANALKDLGSPWLHPVNPI